MNHNNCPTTRRFKVISNSRRTRLEVVNQRTCRSGRAFLRGLPAESGKLSQNWNFNIATLPGELQLQSLTLQGPEPEDLRA